MELNRVLRERAHLSDELGRYKKGLGRCPTLEGAVPLRRTRFHLNDACMGCSWSWQSTFTNTSACAGNALQTRCRGPVPRSTRSCCLLSFPPTFARRQADAQSRPANDQALALPKGSKIWASISESMPIPLSRTRTTTSLPCTSAVIPMRPLARCMDALFFKIRQHLLQPDWVRVESRGSRRQGDLNLVAEAFDGGTHPLDGTATHCAKSSDPCGTGSCLVQCVKPPAGRRPDGQCIASVVPSSPGRTPAGRHRRRRARAAAGRCRSLPEGPQLMPQLGEEFVHVPIGHAELPIRPAS